MNKKQVRLTESDLKQIVKQSVNKILNEAYGTPSRFNREYLNSFKEKQPIHDNDYNGIISIYNQLLNVRNSVSEWHTTRMFTPNEDGERYYDEVKSSKYASLICKYIRKAMDICQMVMDKSVMDAGEQPESYRSADSKDYFDKKKFAKTQDSDTYYGGGEGFTDYSGGAYY